MIRVQIQLVCDTCGEAVCVSAGVMPGGFIEGMKSDFKPAHLIAGWDVPVNGDPYDKKIACMNCRDLARNGGVPVPVSTMIKESP